MEHELTARGAGIVSDDRGLDAELIGCAGLALADAFDLYFFAFSSTLAEHEISIV